MQWDLFCRVIDNLGDIGVCWRLAADLAGRGERVRLWIDDASALHWMAPEGMAGVEVKEWPTSSNSNWAEPGDVVIEAFGCELPDELLARMAAKARPPIWINLEYLSAEPYVERSHTLMSPQASGAGVGLKKWFFYPGFTASTGGLLREPTLMQERLAFDATAWLHAHGIRPVGGEQIVSLFCYQQPQLARALELLARRPTLLLATAGLAHRQVAELLGPQMKLGGLRAEVLGAMPQTDYDRLLWASDLNFVRGEDSFVRAQWAGVPFVWHAYPQSDGAQGPKLDAFLNLFLAQAPTLLQHNVRELWSAWNSDSPVPNAWPDGQLWRRHCLAWRDALLTQPDLASALISFAQESR